MSQSFFLQFIDIHCIILYPLPCTVSHAMGFGWVTLQGPTGAAAPNGPARAGTQSPSGVQAGAGRSHWQSRFGVALESLLVSASCLDGKYGPFPSASRAILFWIYGSRSNENGSPMTSMLLCNSPVGRRATVTQAKIPQMSSAMWVDVTSTSKSSGEAETHWH